ncbi:MAG: lichenicidin A2 family type 2 lantibiotic [Butyrivibrio sp.]|nr:lichenicidin A2 family type 2 lantibiotic [Butyrivibrio sp.]
MGKKKLDQIVGAAYEELNTEDMQQIQGAGDVEAETAVPVIVTIATVASAVYSSQKC